MSALSWPRIDGRFFKVTPSSSKKWNYSVLLSFLNFLVHLNCSSHSHYNSLLPTLRNQVRPIEWILLCNENVGYLWFLYRRSTLLSNVSAYCYIYDYCYCHYHSYYLLSLLVICIINVTKEFWGLDVLPVLIVECLIRWDGWIGMRWRMKHGGPCAIFIAIK